MFIVKRIGQNGKGKGRPHPRAPRALSGEAVCADGKRPSKILLEADANGKSGELCDEDTAKVLDVSIATVERTRCALCEHGWEMAVHGWPPHCEVPRTKLDAWAETHLVGPGLVDPVSNPTIDRAFKK